MEILQTGFLCEKKINDLSRSFFDNGEEVRVKTYFCDEDEIHVVTEIEYGKKIFKGEYSFKKSKSRYYEKYKARYDENAVLKSFYNCAKKIKNINLPWGVMCGVRPAKNVTGFIEDGYKKEEIAEIFDELYGVSGEKFELAYEVAQNESELISKIENNSVSIYIGIPFCPTRCLYCSFVSTDMRFSGKYMEEFCDKLVEEIKETAKILEEKGKYIENIYIGGGTPTSLNEELLKKILSAVKKYFSFEKLKEYTLEAGRVDTINYEKLKIAKEYGVNRISINPQTMKDETLKLINRTHTSQEIENAFNIAREVGFECINADLIAGLPQEDVFDFKNSLERIMKLNPENITVHTMCVKRAAQLRFSQINLSSGKTVYDMLSYASKTLKESGFIPYYMYRQKYMIGNLENVGYSLKGFMSVYNVNIMEEKQTIIALGGGGSSKIVNASGIQRIFNFKDPVEYIRRFDEIIERKQKIKDMM